MPSNHGARPARVYSSRSSVLQVALAPGRSNEQVDDASTPRVTRSAGLHQGTATQPATSGTRHNRG